MPDEDTNLKAIPAKGYARLNPDLRARVADAGCVVAGLFTVIALFASPNIEGIWLRLPVLLAQLLLIACAWYVLRRVKHRAWVVLSHGMVVGLIGIALLAMALHKVSGWTSLAGLLAFVSALALRGSSDRGLVRGRDIRKRERGIIDVVVDNVEGLAAALVLVLLVWHFGLEAFRIPTGSMAPTLLGDPVSGDRVLVDKFVYEYRDPERWEPVVFRYPLRRTDPYVKRCIALPGEQVLIAGGDVYIKRNEGADVELLRKSPDARPVLWLPLIDDVKSNTAWVRNFQRGGKVDFEDGVITFGAKGSAIYPRGETDDEPGNVTDHDASFGAAQTPKDRYGHHVVGDLRLRGDVTLEEDGEFQVTIVRDEDSYELTLGTKGVTLWHLSGDDHAPLAESDLGALELEPGASYAVEYSLADGDLELHINGAQVTRVAVGSPLLDQLNGRNGRGAFNLAGVQALEIAGAEPPGGRKARIELRTGAEAGATLRLRGIDRDIYYVGRTLDDAPGGEHELPFQVDLEGDQYLVLGDNSPGSADCRFWTRITLFMEDGRQVTGAMDVASQFSLVQLLNDARFEDDGETALNRLFRVAHFSMHELAHEEDMQGELVQGSLRRLKETAASTGRGAIDFYTEGGGYVRVRLSEIDSIQVEAHRYVSRNLFVGRPYAVFLSPRGMKLID